MLYNVFVKSFLFDRERSFESEIMSEEILFSENELPGGWHREDSICFEPLSALLREGIVLKSELAACRGPLDRFELINTITVRVIMGFIEKGVRFLSLDGIVISPFAKIGKGTTIHPGTQIRQDVTIGKDCDIGPMSVIADSSIGDGCTVNATQIYSSVLEDGVKIGPFCHVRPNSRLCAGVKIGDFVEVKNSVVGKDTHASHLTYIGDSDVGERVNFGCGTVCVNYNGYQKNRCVIGNDAFIGCNTNLVAPVTIGEGGYTAAGSTITDDVPEGALAIARARQVNKPGWATEQKKKYKK